MSDATCRHCGLLDCYCEEEIADSALEAEHDARRDVEDVRPFANGSEAYDWRAANCDRCQKNGYARDAEPCPMEDAIAMGYILGTIPVEIARRVGASLRDDPGYCSMPTQCAEFAPPATCEFIPRPTSRAKVACGKPATSTVDSKGHTRAVCATHAKRCAKLDAEELASPRERSEGR